MHTFLLYMSRENNLVFFMLKKKMKSSNIQMHKIDTSNYNDWIDILFNTLIVTAFGFWIKPSFDIIWRMSKTETNKTLQIHWIIIVTDVIEHCLLLCFKKNRWLVIKSILFLLLWYPMPYFLQLPIILRPKFIDIYIFYTYKLK